MKDVMTSKKDGLKNDFKILSCHLQEAFRYFYIWKGFNENDKVLKTKSVIYGDIKNSLIYSCVMSLCKIVDGSNKNLNKLINDLHEERNKGLEKKNEKIDEVLQIYFKEEYVFDRKQHDYVKKVFSFRDKYVAHIDKKKPIATPNDVENFIKLLDDLFIKLSLIIDDVADSGYKTPNDILKLDSKDLADFMKNYLNQSRD